MSPASSIGTEEVDVVWPCGSDILPLRFSVKNTFIDIRDEDELAAELAPFYRQRRARSCPAGPRELGEAALEQQRRREQASSAPATPASAAEGAAAGDERRWWADEEEDEDSEAAEGAVAEAFWGFEEGDEAPMQALPSVGSRSHATGRCRPCAFHFTKGCSNGPDCPFCHLCTPSLAKARKKMARKIRVQRSWQRKLAAQG